MSSEGIYIISDEKGIGKTTSLQNWVKNNPKVSGVLSPIVSGKRMFQIIESKAFIPMEAGETTLKVGKYTFNKESFDVAEKAILNTLSNKSASFIILDEIGPLEIKQSLGFHNLLVKLFQQNLIENSTFIFVVRKSCLNGFLTKYKIQNPKVLCLEAFKLKFLQNS